MDSEMIKVRPVKAQDAEELFPLIYKSSITDTICWDGPSSLEDFRSGLKEREHLAQEGAVHQFTIIERKTSKTIGSIDIRPYEELFRGDIGLWIGVPFQGKGYGSEAVRQIVRYGFEELHMEKIEAKIFVGNLASKMVFEKVGFQLEGTLRRCEKKRGRFIDEWVLGILKEEFIY